MSNVSNEKTKEGDVWILGRHRLMCGDGTKSEDVLKLMNGRQADMFWSEPPSTTINEEENALSNDSKREETLTFDRRWIHLSFLCLKDNGSWYCWGRDKPLLDIYAHILMPMEKGGKIVFRNLITYTSPGANDVQYSTRYHVRSEKCLFYTCNGESASWFDNTHAYQSSVKKAANDIWEHGKKFCSFIGDIFIKGSQLVAVCKRGICTSSKENEIVLDLFGGSGSTLLACEQSNRQCYMMEAIPSHCDFIVHRWENFTRKKARLVD
jgi:site-specific DNA-methyltransferase (adenine-specific)